MGKPKKTVIHAAANRAEAETIMSYLRESHLECLRLQALMEYRKKKIDDELAPPITILLSRIAESSEQLRGWALANPTEFGTRRSIELIHGTLGFRIGNLKLVKKTKSTWDDLVDIVAGALGRVYIRTKYEVDRESIIAHRSDIPPDAMEECGLSVIQEDAFFVEPKFEDVKGFK